MTAIASQVRVEQDLLTEMQNAEFSQISVEAVISLRSSDPTIKRPGPEETRRLANAAIKRTEERSGVQPQKVNVFAHLGSLFILAAPSFLREFIKQPEIAAASTNRLDE